MNKTCNYTLSSILLSELKRCIEDLDDYHEYFDDSTISNLEFIKAFGITEFIKELDNMHHVENLLKCCASVPKYFCSGTPVINHSCRIRRQLIALAEEFLPSLYDFSDLLGDYELWDFEFIKAFGIREFIKMADDHVTEELFNLCKSISECEDILELPTGYSRCDGNHKREERIVLKVNALNQSIRLGSDNIYSKEGKIMRKRGFICYKVKNAENSLAKFEKTKKEEGILLFSKLELKNFVKTIRKGKRCVRFAEMYKDYKLFYRGRYFNCAEEAVAEGTDAEKDAAERTDTEKDTAENADIVAPNGKNVYYVRLPEECTTDEYRYCGQYVKVYGKDATVLVETANELWPSEKGDVPMSIRRNKHTAPIQQESAKISIRKDQPATPIQQAKVAICKERPAVTIQQTSTNARIHSKNSFLNVLSGIAFRVTACFRKH